MEPKAILKQYWGYPNFRPMQEDIIRAVMDEKDTLALLPTGGGKSICFQVPALAMEGICLVISPLISLMKDQVEQLVKRGIKATAIYSGMSKREIDITLDNCIYGGYKFLYVSPERLKTEIFVERAKKMNISLLAIDEAHCISQWGYDFRPPYLEIAEFKEAMGISRLIALTATATKEVKEEIQDKLRMTNAAVFQKSFARANLSYSAFQMENKEQKLLEILANVPGTGVVYVRSRKRSREVSELLRRNQVSADYYHGGLVAQDRSDKQQAWISGKVRVMVATNAFGMGIDKPDVRTVVHLDLPDSLEAYYQEAGRAGRDEKKAYAVALWHQQDAADLLDRVERSFVSVEQLRRTYQALANFFKLAIGSHAFSSFEFHQEQFANTYNLPLFETYAALKKLCDEGLLQLSEGFFEQSRFTFLLQKSDLYKFQVANPKLDAIIKTLLRLYGGEGFAGYIKIKEKDIGSLLRTDAGQVRKWLEFLSENEVIDYHPSAEAPTLTFLTPRLNPEHLPIDSKQIAWRKKLALAKAGSVVDYMKSKDCRTQILQRYFDEEPSVICGVCDNDLEKRKQLRGHHLPIDEVTDALEAPRTLTELRALLSRFTEDEIMEAIRILMEDKKVIESSNRFELA